MTDQVFPNQSNNPKSGMQEEINAPNVNPIDEVNIEELAKEIWKLLKSNLRIENERMARK